MSQRLTTALGKVVRPGLASVTFRQLETEHVATLAAQAGLAVIEWGGDVHVPPGDSAAARRARSAAAGAGLEVCAYGSYLVLGGRNAGPSRTAVLDTAAELGAPLVRVWAGSKPSAAADDALRAAVIDDGRALVEQARQVGITVALEHHRGTLTDTADATRLILDAVPGLATLWQPQPGQSDDDCIAAITTLAPWLVHVHVFHWTDDGERRSLADGMGRWRRIFASVAATSRCSTGVLEFVRDDDPAAMAEDAAVLRTLVAER